MDFQNIVDSMSAMTCVVSVEVLEDGSRGRFRIVTGNKAYIDSIEHPAPGTEMLKDKFVPNSEYTDYLTRDLNFEDACFASAVGKKCLHAYAHPDRMDVWFNMMFLPVGQPEGNLSYCLYIMEINFEPDSEQLSSMASDVATSVLDTCIRLRGTNDFKATMQDIIAGIRELCDADHCCILVMNELDRTCYCLGEAFGDNSNLLPMETYLDDDFYDIADSWTDTIAGSDCLIIKDESDMEYVKQKNPVWYESLTEAMVYNIVLFPLKSRNQLLGYMWAINYDKEKAIKIKETLEVTTFILGSELGNYLLLDRLRLIGSKDMLTGVMNRNEMNNVVDEISRGGAGKSSVGVIFADLNGLKTVNDTDGHNAGDTLLKNAASALRSIFDENRIFRAGGDEFAIILTDITEKQMEEYIDRIRQSSEKYDNLSFSLGGSVENLGSNVRLALRHADERMYEDKRKYYKEFPERLNETRMQRATMEREALEQVKGEDRRQDILQEMNYDFLTELPSMTYFFRLADEGRRKMHEDGIDSALLFINLNGMRFFNKRYGLSEGDALIKVLADKIKEQFGKDSCSRFGQDQFAVFTETKDLEKKLNRIFKEMKSANGGRTLPVRCGIYPDSMGIAETSIACDRAKYACDARRDDYHSYFNYFDEEMLQREISHQYVVENIDRAINEGWITAYYQPIVRAASKKVCDEEALARWIDPVKGMLSPADFIPILEDTRLIFKVDMHMVDIILEKIKNRMHSGLDIVPVSVNLSRTDFECCDVVTEVCNRVDAAGVSRDLLTIEITESVIGEDFDFMKEQIERFQKLGFKVWMDDFGSGYSSLDLLQDMQFDCIKFDMRFMRQFETSQKSRIILTELMRMAMSLNIETVTEGVETPEQVEFLREIGCMKMQGYHFSKPVPEDEITRRYKEGTADLGFEDPDEAEYYKAVGGINLYDLGAVSNEDTESIRRYFNTLPMAVVESGGYDLNIIRSNRSYREFVDSYIAKIDSTNVSAAFLNALRQCENIGQRAFVNEITKKGDTINAMVRKIADKPTEDKSAFAVAVLDVTPQSGQTLTYTAVARVLSADYIDLYQVDLKTGNYTQYSPDRESAEISVENRGKDFFKDAVTDVEQHIYKDDQKALLAALTKENIIRSLDENGSFTFTYRQMFDGEPKYVNLKAVRMEGEGNSIIIGVNNVDAQMKQQEMLERMKEETATFARISALMGDFIAIYTVDPETDNYMQYSASNDYSDLGTSRAGIDFFEDARSEIVRTIIPEDLDMFLEGFNKEKILEVTKSGNVYKLYYRLKLADKPVKVCCRAGMVKEKDGPQLVVGVALATS